MSTTITNRQEILFLYEAKDCNPNGDPLDENRPRTDAETGEATVTDVRIKRTIRDYLFKEKNMEILIRDTFEKDGSLKDGKGRCNDFIAQCGAAANAKLPELIQAVSQLILEKCIDARLFGATLPVAKGSIKITGPAQFSAFNRSLHRVSPVFIQQTAAFASKKGKMQKSFAERWLLPYAIIGAYGVINETAAKSTNLSGQDVNLLLEGLWNGTNSLNTHSKMGHQSLLLLRLRHEPGHRIGALAERIKLQSGKEDTALRKTADYTIDISGLLSAIARAGKTIVSVDFIQDERLQLTADGHEGNFFELAGQNKITATPLDL
ncbi:MAG: type I-B CRISPR-associated protein Cas7/Csh2 [Thermodesulfobacteriota bacterium]|nr:type I-B CRISPR-associated protein Cas7/Csh2 [Thermodesulfobacteriota bacterium]